MDNFETFTTVDKAKRDELFDELRKRGLPNELQAVKFSGVQPVLGEDGTQEIRESYDRRRVITTKKDPETMKFHPFQKPETIAEDKVVAQNRLQWQSNYSVAYPRELPKN